MSLTKLTKTVKIDMSGRQKMPVEVEILDQPSRARFLAKCPVDDITDATNGMADQETVDWFVDVTTYVTGFTEPEIKTLSTTDMVAICSEVVRAAFDISAHTDATEAPTDGWMVVHR